MTELNIDHILIAARIPAERPPGKPTEAQMRLLAHGWTVRGDTPEQVIRELQRVWNEGEHAAAAECAKLTANRPNP